MNIEKKFLTVDELATRLGISRSTIYFWAEKKKIPHSKIGKLVRFNPDDITVWLKDKSHGIVV